MESEKMREEFEVWYAAVVKAQEENMPVYCISTLRFSKEVLWEGWKASRESLVVELPPLPLAQRTDEEATFSAGGCDMRRKCSKAIEAAGLKVKP